MSNELIVESQVTQVTVYPDRARVTRQGTDEVTTEIQKIILDELPTTLLPDSVRVSGRGTARVRIQGVDTKWHYYTETPTTRVRELEQEIQRLEDENRGIADRKAGLLARMKYLDGLASATLEFAKGLSRGRTTIADQTQLVTFLAEQDTAIRSEIRGLDITQRDLNKQLEKLRHELKQVQNARPRQRYRATVEVVVTKPGSFTVELSYVVQNAGWQPLYDLRWLENNGGRKLNLTYLAQITQSTGEDWPGVALAVSTARPALNQQLPDLNPWYINVFVPQPPPQAKRMMARAAGAPMPAAAPAVADEMAETAFAMQNLVAPAMAEAEIATAEVETSGVAVTFKIGGATDIPSDGAPHKTTIQTFELDPKVDYLSIPKHTDAVFRRLTVTNTTAAPFLAGPGNLFVGEEFIGTTHLEYAPSGEKMELLFGVEERITVSRELIKRDVDKTFLRDNRQLRYGYKIEVQNLLNAAATVEIHDHIPVSRHEQIKVKLEQVAPEPAERSDLNLLEWQLTIQPSAKSVVQYNYLVEHPRSLSVVGLLD